jgi:hypothetical protein
MEVQMQRRMRTVLGAAATVVSVVGLAGVAGAVGSSGGFGSVPRVRSKVWGEAVHVRSAADLARVSDEAKSLVTTPTVQVVAVHRVLTSVTPLPGGGRVRCFDVSIETTRLNTFGRSLMRAKTALKNWCSDGTRISSIPTVRRAQTGFFGWQGCGWNGEYAGWLLGRTIYGAGGNARFVNGANCALAEPQLLNTLTVKADGTYEYDS